MTTRNAHHFRHENQKPGRTSSYVYLPDGSQHFFGAEQAEPIREHSVDCDSGWATREYRAGSRAGRDQTLTTDFVALPDGSLADLIKDPNSMDKVCFLHWQNGSASVKQQIQFGGKTYTVPDIPASLLKGLRLPTGVQACGGTHNLIKDITRVLSTYVDLPAKSIHSVASLVLGNWVQDRLPVALYTWVTGASGSGKSTLRKLLHCFCRRPVPLCDVTPRQLYFLPDALKCTLLIDESEFSANRSTRELLCLLRAGTCPGIYVGRYRQFFETFSAKTFFSRQPPPDAALGSRAVVISMLPTRRQLPPLDPGVMETIAGCFQPRLLHFRLQNYRKICMPELSALAGFRTRLRDVARALAAPLTDDPDSAQKLIQALREQDEDARLDFFHEREWIVTEALFDLCHEKPVGEHFVSVIAERVNLVLARRGETQRLSAKAVGVTLKTLGLRTFRLGSWGRGFRVTNTYKRQIHELASRFGITRYEITDWMAARSGSGGFPCALCTELNLGGGLEFSVPLERLRARARRIPIVLQKDEEVCVGQDRSREPSREAKME